MARIDLIGQKFGKLTVVKEIEPYRSPKGQVKRKFLCICDCGNTCSVVYSGLKSGRTKSCGCYNSEIARQVNTTHGKRKDPLYTEWYGIKGRCLNPNHSRYVDYGERGIKICDEWLNSFEKFYDYVSVLPNCRKKGYTLDRIDNDGNYEPGNVRWATVLTQNTNQRRTVRLTFDGQTHTLKEWAEITSIPIYKIKHRYYAGKPVNEILRR